MVDKPFREIKKVRNLETEIKTTLNKFKYSSTSNFARDSMMTIVTQNYREYLRLSIEYQIIVPIREVKSVTETYLEILNEWIKREENH